MSCVDSSLCSVSYQRTCSFSGSILSEGVVVPHRPSARAGSPEYRLLEEAGRQLEAVIRQNKGLRNSDLRKFTAQLEKLIAMWKRDDD